MTSLSAVCILVLVTVGGCVAASDPRLRSYRLSSSLQQEADIVVSRFISRIGARSTTCPDGVTVCSDETTCCKLLSGNWACCGFKDATCCTDRNSCCYSGTECCPKRGCCHSSLMCCVSGACCGKGDVCCDDGSCCSKGYYCVAGGGCRPV